MITTATPVRSSPQIVPARSATFAGCPDANTLAGFLDGMLSEPMLQQIDRHIDHCPDCCLLVALLADLED